MAIAGVHGIDGNCRPANSDAGHEQASAEKGPQSPTINFINLLCHTIISKTESTVKF